MSAHDALLDDVAVYALGALPHEQAEEVRKHIAECAECREEYRRLRPAAEVVAYSAEACPDLERGAVIVSPLLKQRVMRAVRGDLTPKPIASPAPPNERTTQSVATMRAVRPIVWPAYAVAAACFAIVLITSGLNLSLNSQMKAMREEVATLRTQVAVASRQTNTERTMMADLMSTDARRFSVPHGEVVTRGTNMYIVMHAMPMPPKGKVYQAWTEANGSSGMSPSITFMPNRNGVAVVKLPQNAARTAALAMSMEPEGGSRQPTSKPEFVVKFG